MVNEFHFNAEIEHDKPPQMKVEWAETKIDRMANVAGR